MTIENHDDLVGLKKIGTIVADCLQLMGKSLEPGITTQELDKIGEDYLARFGAQSAPKITYNFPGTTCISVNHCVAHGVPSQQVLKASDLVNIDISAELGGYFADTGATFVIPPTTKAKAHVCMATRRALQSAMQEARADRPLNVIGKAIELVAKRERLTVIENLGSHGVGRSLHEEPGSIPSYYDSKDKRRLHKGLVITIEPFLSTGARYVEEEMDGWSLTTGKQFFSAQYEHTMVITDGFPLVMTQATKELSYL
ncbi:MAG: type I methionyl aminopeptidase [Oligoflexales bacterium]|nr:type I methionyl aminopeptidase [Oligoflexales bacterium]